MPADPSETRPDDVQMESWVQRYERPLLGYANRLLGGDWAAAHDVVQETFLRLCKTDRKKIESHIAAWLFSVCRTRVIDMQRTSTGIAIDPTHWEIPDLGGGPETQAELAETACELQQQVSQLTGRQQEVIRLRFSGGLSYREIAEVTGLSTGNVGFHLHAAIVALRQQSTRPTGTAEASRSTLAQS